MRGWLAWTSALALVVMAACAADGLWHRGDLESAIEQAEARGTLVMMDFFTEW